MHATIWPAFQDDLAPWASLDYAQEVVAGRLLASIRTATAEDRPSVAIVSNPAVFDEAGLVEPLETPFADRFPAGWVDPGGRWFPIYVQPIVAVHNALRGSPPRGWAEFAEGSPPARLVFDDPARMLTSGPALAELSSAFGMGAWESFVGLLSDRRPLLVADNERAVLEVAIGARWSGLANWNVARRVRPGSPVRHTFLSPTPCIPGFGLLVRDAPSGALGRLFLTWLASEAGQRAYAATGRIPAQAKVDATPSLRTVLPPSVEPIFGTVDWLTDPDRWSRRFRSLLPDGRGPAREGKLA